jgi:MFS family permease
MNPYQNQPQSKKMMTLVGIYLAIIGNLMVSTTTATMLPAAAAEIGGMEIYGVAQSISGVLSIVLMPIFGFLAAHNPAKKPLYTAGALLVGAIVILARALAPNMFVIIFANVFWGFVAAGVFVVGFTTIRDMFDQQQVGLYLGLVGTMMSIARLAGPFLGGIIIDRLGWRVLCWLLFAVLIVAAALNFFGARVSEDEFERVAAAGGSGFDWAGGISITVLLGCLIVALSMGGSYVPFGSALNTALLVIAVVAIIALGFVISKKGDAAIVPASALKDRNVLVLAISNLLHNFGAMTVTFFIPSFIMRVLAEDPLTLTLGPALAAGLGTSASAILGLFLGPIFGKKIAASGDAKPIMHMGNAVRLAVTAGFIFLLVPGTPLWVIYILMFLVGFYNSQTSTTMSVAPQIQLKPELRVTGNSVIQLGQNLGAGIGVALFTLVVGANPAGGMHTSMIIAFVAFVVMTVVAFFLQKNEAPSA